MSSSSSSSVSSSTSAADPDSDFSSLEVFLSESAQEEDVVSDALAALLCAEEEEDWDFERLCAFLTGESFGLDLPPPAPAHDTVAGVV